MSHATYGVVYMTGGASGAGGASAASAVFTTAATAGGVLIAGAAIYLAARKMRADYNCAFNEYQGRSERENAAFALQNARFAATQQKAREMSLSLSQVALDDPNTAFFLGGLGRLKAQISGAGGPNDSGPAAGAALLLLQCDELLASVAAGEATGQFAAYEKLTQAVAQARAIATSGKSSAREVVARELVIEQAAALRMDICDSILVEKRHDIGRAALQTRLDDIETLVQSQPLMALQALGVLRERARGEIRAAGESANREAQNAARMRELVGQISAHAQAVLQQETLEAPKREAQALLKRVSALVAATPVELSALETLATQAQTLFETTEKEIEEAALAVYLEDQVAQVLGGLGYRVTSATNGQDEKKMVAVLDSGLGVQMNLDGKGNLSGEMVAFSARSSEVDAAAEDKVCTLMDDIFDGLRKRNMVVRESKRLHFKKGLHQIPIVQTVSAPGEIAAVAAVKPLEMSVGK